MNARATTRSIDTNATHASSGASLLIGLAGYVAAMPFALLVACVVTGMAF